MSVAEREPATEGTAIVPASGSRRNLIPRRLRNPWGEPRFLVAGTWIYIAWALVPVAIAILFSFNAGRSRSASTRRGFDSTQAIARSNASRWVGPRWARASRGAPRRP